MAVYGSRILDVWILDVRILDARILDARILDARILDAQILDARILDARILDDRILDDRILDDRILDARILDARTQLVCFLLLFSFREGRGRFRSVAGIWFVFWAHVTTTCASTSTSVVYNASVSGRLSKGKSSRLVAVPRREPNSNLRHFEARPECVDSLFSGCMQLRSTCRAAMAAAAEAAAASPLPDPCAPRARQGWLGAMHLHELHLSLHRRGVMQSLMVAVLVLLP